MKIIGVTGLIGSGKGTVADFLIEDGFLKISFADALKDACAVMFGWDREMLEGATDESRAWREKEDLFWSERLRKPGFSPRQALQMMGTEAGRDVFGDDIWIAGVEKKILERQENYKEPAGVVLPDTRFANEIDMIKRLGGTIVRVERGERPDWWPVAFTTNKNLANTQEVDTSKIDAIIHPSESRWIGVDEPDHVIFNNFDLNTLKACAEQLAKTESV